MKSGQRSHPPSLQPVPEWPAASEKGTREGMDVVRPRKPRWRRRAIMLGGAVLLLVGITAAVSRLGPAAISIDKASTWSDAVKRGSMVRQVRGTGTLIPEDIRWATAASPGRIERIALLPGVAVKPDTILVELSNPELEQTVLELDSQASAAGAQREKLRLQLENDRLALASTIATLRSEATVARIEAAGDEALHAAGNGPELNAKRSRAKADELGNRIELEEKRLETLSQSVRAQLVVQDAETARIRAMQMLRRQQLEGLKVRAGIAGVLQRLGDEQPLRIGQHVAAGAPLARIANQSRLKAEIKIAETQAKDVQLGQAAAVDTRNGIIAGKVARIDPAVSNGTVTVDVALQGELPAGARPDLTVDGTITLERLEGVLYVGRPVGVQAEGPARLFKLVEGGAAAVRIPVRLGRSSVDTIEVLEGLGAGDQIIVSDMSQWDSHDRVRLN
jgi:HlyD family secretion protein